MPCCVSMPPLRLPVNVGMASTRRIFTSYTINCTYQSKSARKREYFNWLQLHNTQNRCNAVHLPYCISFRRQFVDYWAIASKILCWCYLMIWPFLYTYRALKCDGSHTIEIFGVVHSNSILCYERNRQNCTTYLIFRFVVVEFLLHYPNLRRWQNRLVYLVCVVSLAYKRQQTPNESNETEEREKRDEIENVHCTTVDVACASSTSSATTTTTTTTMTMLTVNIWPEHNVLPIYLEYNTEAVAQKCIDVPFSTFEWLVFSLLISSAWIPTSLLTHSGFFFIFFFFLFLSKTLLSLVCRFYNC